MLTIDQIYYSEETKALCYPQSRLIDNTGKCTVYFENDIIAYKQVPETAYYGILSARFEQKTGIKYANLYNFIERTKADFYTPFSDKLQVRINIFDHFAKTQPGSVDVLKEVLHYIGVNIPKSNPPVIYSNYFICKRNLFLFYQKNYLLPAMEYLKSLHENHLVWSKSRYKRIPDNWLISYVPLHTFVLEMLPSVFIGNMSPHLIKTQHLTQYTR
jgi:hypothetical protein